MAPRRLMLQVALAALPVVLAGCFDEPPLPETGVPVFTDGFSIGYTPNSFDPAQGADVTALKVDGTKAYSGTSSLRIDVPASSAGFAGGAVLAGDPQDLTATNALVFWATASRAATFGKLGFGLNFYFPNTYQTTLIGLPLTTTWTRHLLPIPDPARLTAEHGMLWYAEDDATAYTAWFDDVKFDSIDPAVMGLQPALASATRTIGVDATDQVTGLSLHYTDFDGTVRAVDSTDVPGSGPAKAFFTFHSSNSGVARVDPTGLITGVALGQASITARLGGQLVPGAITINVGTAPPSEPTTAPPAPTLAAANVIALLSKPYTAVAVDTWGASWSNFNAGANLTDLTIAGDPMKKYTALQFVGIEFIGTPAGAHEIDATSMTHLHVDVWTPDATVFKVKLVDFGANKTYDTPTHIDDSEFELTYNATTTPALVTGQWVPLDIPLSSFTGLVSRAQLAQLVISSSTATVFIDNVYFHK
jgi:hypothetical protein